MSVGLIFQVQKQIKNKKTKKYKNKINEKLTPSI
jgi:hypothetical protein